MASPEFFAETFFMLLFIVFKTAPFWLITGLLYILWKVWVYYVQARFHKEQNYTLLEIKLPQEVTKSPLAMEVVLNAMHQIIGERTFYDRYVLGKARPYFSLELVSLEGQVKFFIRTRSFLKQVIESQIYSQYPNVEIYEVPDYTTYVHYGEEGSDWAMWGSEFTLIKPDVYPIKTYIDYGLDQTLVKEEQKVDPMTPMLEFLGSIGRGEQVWYQILIRANKGAGDKTSRWNRDWQKEAEVEVDKILKKGEKDEEGREKHIQVSSGEKKVADAIQKSLTKHSFDCGMRGIYLAKKDVFSATRIPGLVGTLKQYSSPDLNGLRPSDVTDVEYPWQDYSGARVSRMKKKMFDAFRRRSWFFPPYERKPFLLNTEELATIYHFPGGVAETPTFGRIDSKRAEPPINLPL